MIRRDPQASAPRILALVLIVTALATIPGCFSMRSAAAARTEPAAAAPPEAWPARDLAAAERLRSQTPPVVPWYDWDGGTPPAGMSDAESARLRGVEAEVTDAQCLSGGLLRIYREPEEESDEMSRKFAALLGDFEPSGSYVSSYVLESGSLHDWLATERELRKNVRPLPGTAPEGLRRSLVSAEIVLGGGVEFQLPPPGASGRRGLILHFSALMTNEYEKEFLDQLRQRGWAVIDFDTWSGVQCPRDSAAMAKLPELDERRKALEAERWELMQSNASNSARFQASLEETSTVVREMSRIRRGWFTACSQSDVDGVGRAIAAATDGAFAENAYAAEAVLDYIKSSRPDIPTSPLVVLGFSAGAIAAPAVATRLGPRVDAVVLIGGGADLLAISRTTNQRGAAIKVLCDEQPVDDALYAAIDEAYLRHTHLDPYTLAPLLTHTPVLTVHASDDITVPAATGETLYQRLGRPDRLNFAGDHYKLFYFIPGQAGRVAGWLERHVPR